MRQLDAIPFSNYSVSIWGLSIWLWMLPIKEIRLKMFQHERQPLKTTSGLLFPLSMRANPMAWQCRPAGEENTLLEWNLVSIRAHQHGEIPVMMCMRPSLVCPCTALAEGLQISAELQMDFTFVQGFVGTLCLQECTEVRLAFCLQLCHYEIENCWGCQSGGLEAGVVIATESRILEISLPMTSPVPARGIQMDRTFKVWGQLSGCGWILLFSSF